MARLSVPPRADSPILCHGFMECRVVPI